MNKAAITEASNMDQDRVLKESFEETENKKSKDPFMTPQRKDETLRK